MASPLGARAVALLVVLAAVMAAAGCGGGTEQSQSSQAPPSSEATLSSQPATGPETSDEPTTLPASGSSGTTLVASEAQFTRENWEVLAADPEAYKGARVQIVGRLLQEPTRRDDGAFWQMYADPKNYDWNTSVHYSDPSFPATIYDFVRVTGTVKGALEGENAYGEKVSLVDISADTAEVVDVMAAASPAAHTTVVDASIDQHGLVITLDRIEFAVDETRVFVQVANGSNETASLYDLQVAKATQEGTEYDAESLWDYYPTVEWELPPGADSEGIIVFPPLDESRTVEVLLDAWSDDNTLSFEPYVFVVPPPD
jgi:hypothetical protein